MPNIPHFPSILSSFKQYESLLATFKQIRNNVRMRLPRRLHSGYLLLEVFVAMSIFLVVGTLIIFSASYLFRRQQVAILQSRAGLLAQESIEVAYNLALNDWSIIDNLDNQAPLHPVVNGGVWTLQPGSDTINDFIRTITIRRVERDSNGQIVVPPGSPGTGIPDDNTRLLTVTVQWTPPAATVPRVETATHFLLKPEAVTTVIPPANGSPSASCQPRVDEDLVALYTFEEGSGTTVQDRSGVGTPLNLNISSASKVAWLPATKGLRILDPTVTISSNVGSGDNKASSMPKSTNEITIEAWYRPHYPTQTGENGGGRIIVLSDRSVGHSINYILGQELSTIIGRLRIRMASSNPDFSAAATWYPLSSTNTNAFNENQLSHFVFTREPNPDGGEGRLYLNGNLVGERYIPGDFNKWVNTFDLGIGNDLLEPWPAAGEYYLAAIYSRALDEWEVGKNFTAGPQNNCQLPTIQTITYTDPCASITDNVPNANFSGWNNGSIGTGTVAGRVSTSGTTTATICGSGQSGEYTATADHGEFFYVTSTQARMELTGKLELWSPPGHNLSSFPHPYSFAGVEARSLPLAEDTSMFRYSINGMGVLTLTYRNNPGQSFNHFFGSSPTVRPIPIWFKLVKYNNYFGHWYSEATNPIFPDDWVYHNPREINGFTGSNYAFGFYVSSEFNGKFARARFTNIDVKYGNAAFNLCGSGMCVPGGGGGGNPNEPPPGDPPGGGGGNE